MTKSLKLVIDFSDEAKALLADFIGTAESLTRAIQEPTAFEPDEIEAEKPAEKPKSKPKKKADKEPESTEITLETLRAALGDYLKKNGKAAAASLVKNHGVESLTKCPPEKYAAIAADLGLE